MASFHTFMQPTFRPCKIIIRNLHHLTLILDISDGINCGGPGTGKVGPWSYLKIPKPTTGLTLDGTGLL